MRDLISRKQAIQRMIEEIEIIKKNYIHINEIKRLLQDVDTIEAVPVVHGEWIYENYTWHCGVCGFQPFKGYIPKEPGFNLCPNCGADMRKGGTDQ